MTCNFPKLLFLFLLLSACSLFGYGQIQLISEDETPEPVLDFSNPKTYEVGGITYTGVVNFDTRMLMFKVGD